MTRKQASSAYNAQEANDTINVTTCDFYVAKQAVDKIGVACLEDTQLGIAVEHNTSEADTCH